jgi:integrase
VRLGPKSGRTGKPKPVPLLDELGRPIAREDIAGKDAAIARLEDRPTAADQGPTVRQVCNAYLAWHEAQGSKPATIRTHWYHLGRFADFVAAGVRYADRPAASIVPRDLGAIKHSGQGAIRHLYMSVMACWRWAARAIEDREPERLIPENPLRDLIRPRGGQRPSEATPWPVARRVLRMARGWARQRAKARIKATRAMRWVKVQALVGIAYSGARTAEMVTLEWDDIRWDEGVAAIPVDRHKTGSRVGKMRYVPLLPRLIRVLRVIERWPHRHDRYVFATRWHKGRPKLHTWWSSIREDIKPYVAGRGVELPEGWRPYFLRHSFATAAARAVGKEKASKALGHSPQALDAHYDHVEADRVREVGEAVERARKASRR